MRRSVASAPGRPRRYRHAVNSVTCWCIAEASAVDPQDLASVRWAMVTSRIVAPRPPSSSGTAIARYPDERSRSNASVTKVPSRSWSAAWGAICAASSPAQLISSASRFADASGVVVGGVVVGEVMVGVMVSVAMGDIVRPAGAGA